MDTSTVKKALLEGGIEGVILGLMTHFRNAAVQIGTDLLKEHAGGRGTNDEALDVDGAAYAVLKFDVSRADVLKIKKVLNSLTGAERRRAVETFGKGEQQVTDETPFEKDGVAVNDNKGKRTFIKTTTTVNIRGARAYALLAPMTEDEIKDFLRGANVLDTMDNRIKKILASPEAQKVKDSLKDFGTDAQGYLKKKSFLVKLAEKKSGKTIN